jgi:hypothetical protein
MIWKMKSVVKLGRLVKYLTPSWQADSHTAGEKYFMWTKLPLRDIFSKMNPNHYLYKIHFNIILVSMSVPNFRGFLLNYSLYGQ